MSGITTSNVEDFKTEHECDEHWELRRKFLLAHSEKFSRDELVCLAQVFTNVEFLGCRYPKETMQMISELSDEVVTDYRAKQKNRLQRTFVKASDAASSRAKGQSRQQEKPKSTAETSCKPLLSNFTKSKEETTTTQNQSIRSKSPIRFPKTIVAPLTNPNLKRGQQQERNKFSNAKKKKKLDTNDNDIVLFEYPNDNPQSIVARIANSNNNINVEWKFNNIGENVKCIILCNKKNIGQGVGQNQKASKKEASIVALEELKKHYYTIKVTKNLTPTVPDGNLGLKNQPVTDDSLKGDNIGSKMMKLMGWSGGGLGKQSQGITEPVSLQQHISREGLGLKSGMFNMGQFKKKCHEVLQNYLRGDTSLDLVFSPSFSNEERAIIHQVAQQIGLKSQSYGPKSQRTLTISRKIHPMELVHELLELGGVTEKYELVKPLLTNE